MRRAEPLCGPPSRGGGGVEVAHSHQRGGGGARALLGRREGPGPWRPWGQVAPSLSTGGMADPHASPSFWTPWGMGEERCQRKVGGGLVESVAVAMDRRQMPAAEETGRAGLAAESGAGVKGGARAPPDS